MEWKFNQEAKNTIKTLFGDNLRTDANPFYMMHVKATAMFANTPVTNVSKNQLFAKKINQNSYLIWGQLVLSYKKSIHTFVEVLFKCRYNKLTGALTQIEITHTDSEFATKTSLMKARRTGTVTTMLEDVAAFMGPRITKQCGDYWKGFTDYYAEKTKTMCGYYLD